MTTTDRDALAETLRLFGWEDSSSGLPWHEQITDAILASDWLAARDRAVAAQALRDAADDFEDHFNAPTTLSWLRDRADTYKETP